jgi:hypothetical protein
MHKSITNFGIFVLIIAGNTYAEAEEKKDSDWTQPVQFGNRDYTWLNGNSRQTEFPLQTKYFTGQVNFDANYVYSFKNPKDHTLVGSTNSGRTNETQIQQIGLGGDFYYNRIRARFMTQFGMYSTMTPRNDASPSRGQWQSSDAYRYFSEAYAGYQIGEKTFFDVGIFMSYIGLCSYYNYENWVYQMSYVSANTPWFFNGARIQSFPTDKLKAEFWLINGWQSYGMYHETPGAGFTVTYRPTENWSFVTNNYYGYDTLNNGHRKRIHSDSSLLHKYYENPKSFISKAAFSATLDVGCEDGGGVSCTGGKGGPSQTFAGFMVYNRLWFKDNKYGLTIGGGAVNNPGRYLALMPAVNGATAASGTPSFTQNPGDKFSAWDSSVTFDYLPSQFLTFRVEYNHREANVPYFAGSGGITPKGGNQGTPGSTVSGFEPDLTRVENRITSSMMVRF